jgi:nucleotide-binding universal stress UspA family protein
MTEQTVQARSRVVVGVDGSPAAQEAVRFAAREAVLRDAALVAMMSVHMPDLAWIDPYAIREHPEAGHLERAEDKLRSILAAIDTAGADVEPVVSTEPAPAALVAASTDAELLVVGSRGRGGFRGMVMGSVSLQCVLHAHCPVTVVRPEPRAEETAAAAAHARHTLEYARRQTTPTFL